MPNNRISGSDFGASMLSGLLQGVTRRYQQGQAQQREDQVYQTQLGDRERLAQEQRDFKVERSDIDRNRVVADRQQDLIDSLKLFTDKKQAAADIEINTKKQLAEMGLASTGGATPKPITSLGAATAEAKKSFPQYDKNTVGRIGQIMWTEKIGAYEAAAALFNARNTGRDIGGLPDAPESGVTKEGRRSDLIKDLKTGGIVADFQGYQAKYGQLFSDDTEAQDKFVFNTADRMMEIEGRIMSGEQDSTGGMSSKMAAVVNTIAEGYAGTPGKNWADSIALSWLQQGTRDNILSVGTEKPLPLDALVVNEAASTGANTDVVIFTGTEPVTFDDIILKMVMQGYDEESIRGAILEIFEPANPAPMSENSIGKSATSIMDALSFGVRKAMASGQNAAPRR